MMKSMFYKSVFLGCFFACIDHVQASHPVEVKSEVKNSELVVHTGTSGAIVPVEAPVAYKAIASQAALPVDHANGTVVVTGGAHNNSFVPAGIHDNQVAIIAKQPGIDLSAVSHTMVDPNKIAASVAMPNGVLVRYNARMNAPIQDYVTALKDLSKYPNVPDAILATDALVFIQNAPAQFQQISPSQIANVRFSWTQPDDHNPMTSFANLNNGLPILNRIFSQYKDKKYDPIIDPNKADVDVLRTKFSHVPPEILSAYVTLRNTPQLQSSGILVRLFSWGQQQPSLKLATPLLSDFNDTSLPATQDAGLVKVFNAHDLTDVQELSLVIRAIEDSTKNLDPSLLSPVMSGVSTVTTGESIAFLNSVQSRVQEIEQAGHTADQISNAITSAQLKSIKISNLPLFNKVVAQLNIDLALRQAADIAIESQATAIEHQFIASHPIESNNIEDSSKTLIQAIVTELKNKESNNNLLKLASAQYDNDQINLQTLIDSLQQIITATAYDTMPDYIRKTQDLETYLDVIKKVQTNIQNQLKADATMQKTHATIAAFMSALPGALAKKVNNTDANYVVPPATLATQIENVTAKITKLQQDKNIVDKNSSSIALTKEITEFNANLDTDVKIPKTTKIDALITLYQTVLDHLNRDQQQVWENSPLNQATIKLNAALSGDLASLGGALGQVPGAAGQVVGALQTFVGDVFLRLGIDKNKLSPKALIAIAAILTAASPVIIAIANNNNLTAEQKSKMQKEALAAMMGDITNVVAADITGADADAIASGNVEDIAMSAGLNKVINSLVPEDTTSSAYYNSSKRSAKGTGNLSNLDRFQSDYGDLLYQAPLKPGSSTTKKVGASSGYGSTGYGSSSSSSTTKKVGTNSGYGSTKSGASSSASSYVPFDFSSGPTYEELMAM